MKVFLDSSVICSDFHMKGAKFELFNKMCLPIFSEVVLDEVKNRYRLKIQKYVENINKSSAEISALTGKTFAGVAESVVSIETKEYEDFFDLFIMINCYGETLPYPQISHKDVVKRILAHRKPFTTSEVGYRDFLIWETFLSYVAKNPQEKVFFVTENTNDFSDEHDRNQLHQHYKDDISKLGVDISNVVYYGSFQHFIDEQIKPVLQKIQEKDKYIKVLLSEENGFIKQLEKKLLNYLIGIDLTQFDINVPGQTSLLHDIECVDVDEITDVAILDDENILVNGRFLLDSIVKSPVRIVDYKEIEDDIYEYYSIADEKQNGRDIDLYISMTLHIQLSIIYNKKNHTISSYDIEYLDDGNCPYCPY